MGSEVLSIPEEKLEEFMAVIEAGLGKLEGTRDDISEETRAELEAWCEAMREYLDSDEDDEDECPNESCTLDNLCDDCRHYIEKPKKEVASDA